MSERQASTYRQGSFTNAHLAALQILSQNHVQYKAEEYVAAWGHFDGKGRPIVYRCDIVINDPDFGAGVIEIDGLIHHREKQAVKDLRKDARLQRLGLWVERIENDKVSDIVSVLEHHRRQRDDYS